MGVVSEKGPQNYFEFMKMSNKPYTGSKLQSLTIILIWDSRKFQPAKIKDRMTFPKW